jgi:hypothetical protein
MPVAPSLEELRAGRARIAAACAAAGRDAAEIGLRGAVAAVRGADGGADVEKSLAALAPLAEAGATLASFALAAFARGRDEIAPVLARIGRAARG